MEQSLSIIIALTILLSFTERLTAQSSLPIEVIPVPSYPVADFSFRVATAYDTCSGVVKTYYADGVPESETAYLKGIKHGPYIEYYKNGKQHYTGQYWYGNEIGFWTTFDEKGNHDITMEVDTTGITPKTEVEFCGTSFRNGADTTYGDSGNVMRIATYKDGYANGRYRLYWESGNLRETGTLDKGTHVGKTNSYNQNGALHYTVWFDKKSGLKKRIKLFHDDGRKLQKEYRFNPEGEVIRYDAFYPNGGRREKFRTETKDGSIRYVYVMYDENGILLERDAFEVQ